MKLNKSDILICLFLILSTYAVYARVIHYDFVNFDDDEYVTENKFVNNGISLDSIGWAFTHSHSANWHPLTWISHMIDCQFFGLNAGWHHLTNLIFHILNTLLLFILLRLITGKLWQSGFVAALFALHPLHVESVAWISERKDVLSTFFWMLTLLSYFWYVRGKSIFRFCAVILFFLCGLMSKPMLVTLPFVLLLLDYWPLKRFQFQHAFSPHRGDYYRGDYSSISFLFFEKIPLFFLSIISCLITLLAQHYGQAVRSFDQVPFLQRVANAFVSYATYIFNMIYPVNLCVLYPYNGIQPWWKIAGSVFLIIFITFFSIRMIKTHPYFIVGWLWYLGTLVPVIGLVQVGTQSMADRYTYIPLIGLFVIIAWGIPRLLPESRHKKLLLLTASFCFLFMCMMMTLKQVTYWKNGLTLSSRAVDVTKGNFLMENNLANMLVRKGENSKGIVHYIKALQINPDDKTAYKNLMLVMKASIPDQTPAENMKHILSFYPKEPALYFIEGKMLRDESKDEQAITYFKKAIQMDKQFISAYYELSSCYMLNHKFKDSLLILKQLVALQPDSPLPCVCIAQTYQKMKNRKNASEWYRRATEKGYEPSATHSDEGKNGLDHRF